MLSIQPAKGHTANVATAFSMQSASSIPEASNDAHTPADVQFAEIETYRPSTAAKLNASTRAISMESRAAMDDGDRLAALL